VLASTFVASVLNQNNVCRECRPSPAGVIIIEKRGETGATACPLDSYRSIIQRVLLGMTLVLAYLLTGSAMGSSVYGIPVQGDAIVLSYLAQGVFASEEVIAEIAGTPSSAGSLAAVSDDLYVNGTWVGGGVTESSFG
jgi:hypothetical protein